MLILVNLFRLIWEADSSMLLPVRIRGPLFSHPTTSNALQELGIGSSVVGSINCSNGLAPLLPEDDMRWVFTMHPSPCKILLGFVIFIHDLHMG
jgi:hypothetical protein